MGTSHFKSNIAGKSGTETISGFDTISTSKIKLGSTQYLLAGSLNTAASIVAVAIALTSTPQGSLYISTAGTLWIFNGATTATSFATVA